LAFWVHWAANSATLAAEEARLSAEHARRGGDVGMWSRALGWYIATLLYGPESAATIARELDAIERQRPGPYLTACVELGRAEVSRLEGRIQSARERAGSALEQFRALGMRTMAATCDQTIASIELSAGEPARAVAALTRSDAILAEFGESAMRSTTQGLLARSHALLGATDSAAAAIELAEQLSAPQDVTNLALTDGARARLALAAGDDESAERWARSAVEHAERTDFVGFRAYALLDLAVVLSARGATGEARRHAGAALAAFEAKGDQPGAAEARPLAADIPGGDLRTGSFGTGG
jgi:ATP/maltotriose-dependent transcriptional regulator MalT